MKVNGDDVRCPDCAGPMAVKGKRVEKDGERLIEQLLVCAGCGREKWQRLYRSLPPSGSKVNVR